jgi:putative ABC transport system permease protein
MRFVDVLGMALAALWQQKTRTILTTLGVLFGSFVLAASVSIDHGVQETIERESRRSSQLRRIDVRPGWEQRENDIPPEELKVKGRLSDARRERLRKALVSHRLMFAPSGPRVALNQQRLRSLAAFEHVRAVNPVVQLHGWAAVGGQSGRADAVSADLDDEMLRKRLVAGRFFESTNEPSALVTEFLLYQLGITDDAAMDAVLGQKLRLEIHVESDGGGLGLYLRKPDGFGTTHAEQSAIDKIQKQLAGRLDRFDLAPEEREALSKALGAVPVKAAEVYRTDLTIAGILRPTNDEEGMLSWEMRHADVVLPAGTAQELFFRAPIHGERGVDRAVVVVDEEKNVKEVLERVRGLGLNAFAATEFIDRQRLMWLLIFGAMTCVAGVALLVAALGIANTMLMSVLERTREVGIMKAVGAGNVHIQLIFLVEGALIGLAGAVWGLVLAWAASLPADRWLRSLVKRDMNVELKETLFVFPPWLLATVVGFAVLVTTLAAVYPARRAAKVNPVTALRHE